MQTLLKNSSRLTMTKAAETTTTTTTIPIRKVTTLPRCRDSNKNKNLRMLAEESLKMYL